GDQDIDRRDAIEVFEPPAYLRPGPHVDRCHMRFSAVSSALRSHPVETLAVAAQQPEARPLAGVAQRQSLADSAGCAGEDDRGWHEQSNSMFTKPVPGAGLSGTWCKAEDQTLPIGVRRCASQQNWRPMSALGQKQTKRHHGAMSALPPRVNQ